MSRAYPSTKEKTCDVLALGGRAKSCYLSGGQIIPALSVDTLIKGPSQNVLGAFYTPSNNRFYTFCKHNLIYTDNFEAYFVVYNQDSLPFGYYTGDSENYGILTAKKYIRSVGTDGFKVLNYDGCVRDGLYKNNRIFGANTDDDYTIVWSSPGSPLYWMSGDCGYLRLNTDNGIILKLVALGENIAVVCNNGIVLLSAFGATENFKLTYNGIKFPQIYKQSVCVAGGKVYFYTTEGVYAFDGSKAEKLENRYLDSIKTPKSCAVLGNEYYVLGTDADGESIIAVYNTENGESYYIPADYEAIVTGGAIYGFGKNRACVLKSGGKYLFESDAADFGTTAKKTLEELVISAEEAVDVKIESDGKSRIYEGVNGKIRPRMRGDSFKISISGYKKVYSVTARAEV